MKTKPIQRISVAALFAVLLLSSCATKSGSTTPAQSLTQIQKVIAAETAIAQGVGIAANTSSQLVSAGTITADEATKIQTILTDVENANRRAINATNAIAILDVAGKASILSVVQPILTEVQNSIQTGDVAQIKNQSAKLAIVAALSTLVTSLQVIQGQVL